MKLEVVVADKKRILKDGLRTLLVSGLSTGILIFFVSVLSREAKLTELLQINQWLARDIASQFTGAASRTLIQAQKFSAWVQPESGSFDSRAQNEFDNDLSLKAVWVVDIGGIGPLQPLARLDRGTFQIDESVTERLRGLLDVTLKNGAAAQGVTPSLNAVSIMTGDRPRAVVLFFDESFFSRASGGPFGDKWYLLAPSADKTESVLVEATGELRTDIEYPSFNEIAAFVTSETPAQERAEFSREVIASSGDRFQLSGVATGAYGVVAVVVTPLSEPILEMPLLLQLALGISVAITALVMLWKVIRAPRSTLSN